MRISLEVINLLVLINNDLSTLETIHKNLSAASRCYHQEFNNCFPIIVDEYEIPNRHAVDAEIQKVYQLTTDIITDLRTLAGSLCINPYMKKLQQQLNYAAFKKLDLHVQDTDEPDTEGLMSNYIHISDIWSQTARELALIISDLKKAREALSDPVQYCNRTLSIVTPSATDG